MVADILSHYGVDGAFESTANASYSMSDRSVRRVVHEWRSVVTKHLDFDACVTAAVEALSR